MDYNYTCPICETVHTVDSYEVVECSCGNEGYYTSIKYQDDDDYYEEFIWDYYTKKKLEEDLKKQ
jgi:hypothetical protein